MDPSVLVVIADALRVDRVGHLNGRDLTPHLDTFTQDAAVFTRAYSTTNVTDSAVTSLQTGRYPLSHGVVNHGFRVTDDEKRSVERVVQLPEVLSEAGYATAKFGRPLGRWHRNGFDVYPSASEDREPFDDEWVGKSIWRRLSNIHPALGDVTMDAYHVVTDLLERTQGDESTTGTDDVVDSLEDFVEAESPFYAFVHLMDTHAPYEADPKTVARYLNEFEYTPRRIGHHKSKFSRSNDRKFKSDDRFDDVVDRYYYSADSPSSAVVDAHYDAAVTETDERFGEILDLFRSRGLLDDTLVVFLADHGESLTEHGIYYDHHGLYEVTTRIPLVIRPPGGADARVEDLVQITDVAPTVLSYTDPDGIGLNADGTSLRSAMEGGTSLDRDYVMAEEAHAQRRRMIRRQNGDKLLYDVDGDRTCRLCDIEHGEAAELYDVETDPLELDDHAKTNQSTVERLRELAEKGAETYETRRFRPNSDDTVEYDDEEEIHERLRALGYR